MCHGSIRAPSANPLGKSLGHHSRLFTSNSFEEETVIFIQIKSTIYSQGFLDSNEEKERKKARSQITLTPVEDPAIVFASAQLILLYLGTAAVAFQTCSIGEKIFVTWQSMVGREDIVGRVAQYVDEHYPVDKWHLGDLIAWVAQSALKYRPHFASCQMKDH
ncbi:hypothetical protein TNCV_188621 [Trichonephila clavipes]|nr:hypothetical protein TNCV_188621 [Trichonephila clavipes]